MYFPLKCNETRLFSFNGTVLKAAMPYRLKSKQSTRSVGLNQPSNPGNESLQRSPGTLCRSLIRFSAQSKIRDLCISNIRWMDAWARRYPNYSILCAFNLCACITHECRQMFQQSCYLFARFSSQGLSSYDPSIFCGLWKRLESSFVFDLFAFFGLGFRRYYGGHRWRARRCLSPKRAYAWGWVKNVQ